MLKLMSGGDALSMAKMRQDQEVFKPTHKGFCCPLTIAHSCLRDPAFRGRVRMIPFSDRLHGSRRMGTLTVFSRPWNCPGSCIG